MSMYELEQMLSAGGGLLINIITAVIASALGNVVLGYAMRWFIFKKAGEKGWKGLIPFYSDYITYKIAWDGRIYIALILGSVASAIIGTIAGWIHPGLGAVISMICNVAVSGATAVAGMILQFKLARAFGRNDYFAVGLYFLGSVFTAILAFGDSQYKGAQVNDGIGVPRFIESAGQRASAAAANAASAAAQQLQQHQAAMQQQAAQQQYQQQNYAPNGYAPTASQQPYQPQGYAQQQYPQQGYPQAPQQGYPQQNLPSGQRTGRRASNNYNQYHQ